MALIDESDYSWEDPAYLKMVPSYIRETVVEESTFEVG